MSFWNRTFLLRIGFLALLAGSVTAAQQAPASAPAPAATAPATPPAQYRLRNIFIAEDVETAQKLELSAGVGFLTVSQSLGGFDLVELNKRLGGAAGQVIDNNLIQVVGKAIEIFVHERGYPNAISVIPDQDIATGTMRVALFLKPPIIRKIVVGEGIEDSQKFAPPSDSGFVALSPSLSWLNRAELAKRLSTAENLPFQEKLVAAIAQVIELFVKQSDFPAATIVVPPQNPSDGTLRVAIQRGKIRNITISGNRWFSDSLFREKLRIEKGDTLRYSILDGSVSWLNNSPFRRVTVRVDPVGNTGETDLTLLVKESFPLRAQASYDNGGNEVIGKHRFTAAASYANLFGKDHQVSYQAVTTNLGPDLLLAQALDYRVPLTAHDSLQFSGSYLHSAPELVKGLLTQDGQSITAALRYNRSLNSSSGIYSADLFSGIEYKQTNNNLLFISESTSEIVQDNRTDIFQFILGASVVRRDRRGGWIFGANLNLSPGNVNSYNSVEDFHEARAYSRPAYAYGNVTLQRVLNMPYGWTLNSRGTYQIADGNILPSEQLYIGGASSVRGFRENVAGGDRGYFFSHELLTPLSKDTLEFLSKNSQMLETRFAIFFDAGKVRLKQPVDTDVIPPHVLASSGFGVRMNVGTRFSFSGDYGRPLVKPNGYSEKYRIHLRAGVSF